MVVISVDVPKQLAKKLSSKKIVPIDTLYEIDDISENWTSVKVWEKASVVLDYLKSIK